MLISTDAGGYYRCNINERKMASNVLKKVEGWITCILVMSLCDIYIYIYIYIYIAESRWM